MLPDTVVKTVGKHTEPPVRIAEDRLGNRQLLRLRERIVKQVALQSHQHSCLIILIPLRFAEKISAVYKHHAVTPASILRGIPVRQNHRRIILMAGRASAAANRVSAVPQLLPL